MLMNCEGPVKTELLNGSVSFLYKEAIKHKSWGVSFSCRNLLSDLAQLLISCVTLNKLFDLSDPHRVIIMIK